MEDYEGNGGMSARRQLVSTGRGGTKRAQRAQRTHRTHRTGHRSGSASGASGASRSGHNMCSAECRVQSAGRQRAQQRLWGPGPRRQLGFAGHGPPMPPKRHALAAPLAGVTSSDKLTLPLPRPCRFCCETFAELHPSFAAGPPSAPLLHCSIAPRLHCFIAPLLHCSIAPLPHSTTIHSLTPSTARRTHQTHSPIHSPTHSPAHPPTHPRAHSIVSVSVSVSVSVPRLLLPLLLSASTPPHHAARLGSAPRHHQPWRMLLPLSPTSTHPSA
jgi:hypothetical protein